MKKIITLLIVSAMVTSVTAYADTIYSFNNRNEDKALLALYKGSILRYCKIFDIEKTDSVTNLSVPDEFAKDTDNAKVVLYKSGKIISDIIKTSSDTQKTNAPKMTPTANIPTAIPTNTTVPANTSVPSEATQKPTLNPVYPREVDAVGAFAVVRDVRRTLLNDETCYALDVLYQGRECTFYVDNDVYISSSPIAGPNETGSEMQALKEGDIISLKASLSGKIEDVVLVMRPPSRDILTSGKDYGLSYENLFSNNYIPSAFKGDRVYTYNTNENGHVEYVFGVITDKTSDSITLYASDGKSKHSLDIDIDKNTCVYGIDADKNSDASLETTGFIRKSSIPKSYYDDDDNITEWNEDCEYVYALVRMVDDTATDIAVITY